MWYTGRSPGCADLDDVFPSSGSVGLAVSTDGVHWRRGAGLIEGARGPQRALDVGKCLGPNGDWWWFDTCHLSAGDVQILSSSSVSSGEGVYWMFYAGGSFEQAALPAGLSQSSLDEDGPEQEGLRLRPGLAMSQDGRNWARIEAEHHTGALFDVGAAGEWDELFVGGPQVVAAGPRDMRMYYHSFDRQQQRFRVGVATSPDGFKWTKRGKPIFEGGSAPDDFDCRGAAARCVVRDIDSKRYFMFYEGVGADGGRSIGVAVSDDGLSGWQRCPQPVLAGSGREGGWDAADVGCPWAVSMAGGKWRLYYSGRAQRGGGGWGGVGLARSDEAALSFQGAPTRFERHQWPAPTSGSA
ncbi:transcriptional regulator [Micractinium conductrix]|uniref:Transcriptional regulator n=1 Tax=Micractinium conductrix TaxID=554055 RepID=A0A2P6VAF2_9CHLO|nr:transcriptional regulator [Micractinium conductrix]|eukprot:PSC71076.1 transcriptional regulator [Micractinium conductrix]